MRLDNLLVEGLIKLPPQLLEKAEKHLLQVLLTHFKFMIKIQGKKHKLEKVKEGTERYEKWVEEHYPGVKFKTMLPWYHGSLKTLDVDKNDLDPRYQKLMKGKFRPLKLRILRSHEGLKKSGTAGLYSPVDNSLNFNLEMFYVLTLAAHDFADGSFTDAERSLETAILKLKHSLKHELSHALQFEIFGKVDPSQIDQKGTTKAELGSQRADQDKYYTSKAEFDPQIKTAVGQFLIDIRELKKRRVKNWSPVINFFTGSISLRQMTARMGLQVSDLKHDEIPIPSEFFRRLKELEPQQWKRAVKYFTTAVEKELK